jgi:hypothetical protein
MFWNGGVKVRMFFSLSFFIPSVGFAPPSLARKKKVEKKKEGLLLSLYSMESIYLPRAMLC